jgi:hypothetical protein
MDFYGVMGVCEGGGGVGIFEARKMLSEHFDFTFVLCAFVEWFWEFFFGRGGGDLTS